ncbi:MAG: sulfotransferase [Pseudomonadota bacterium]
MAEADASWTQYTRLEKLLHQIAFATPGMPRIFGQLDRDIFAPKELPEPAGAPVFVTGLPRAGTTLLLELLMGSGAFSSFTYRHMPFVLAPCMWAKFTGSHRKEGAAVERSHGDGMEITFDSPEAFEEVMWLAFHKKDYVQADHLSLMDKTALDPELAEFFQGLARRLMVTGGEGPKRYLSKNNANIARLDKVSEVFPDAEVLICLRDPVSHANSLQRQHTRFLGIHDEDPFAAKYMRWIGHFDFGAEFRPIRFGETLDVEAPDFWLRYWIDAYAYLLDKLGEGRHIFCYEALQDNPEGVLGNVADRLDLSEREAFLAGAARVRPAVPLPEVPPEQQDAAKTARALYADLRARAI